MTFAQIAPLLGVWLIAVVAPGPDFITLLRVSAARGRAQGMAVAGGVISGIACWAMLAMAGLGALLTRYAHVYA